MRSGPTMRTPDSAWTLDSIINKQGVEVYLVKRRTITGATTQILGTVVSTLDQAALLMGEAFDLLTPITRAGIGNR